MNELTEEQLLNQIEFLQRFVGRRDLIKVHVRQQIDRNAYTPLVCDDELQKRLNKVAREVVIKELESYQKQLFQVWDEKYNRGGKLVVEYPIAKNYEELSEEKQKEFEELANDYSMVLQKINLFIEVNELDSDEIWDKANQQYDSDMSYAPNEG